MNFHPFKNQIISAPFIDGAYDLLNASKSKKLFVASSIPDSELKQLKKGILIFQKHMAILKIRHQS